MKEEHLAYGKSSLSSSKKVWKHFIYLYLHVVAGQGHVLLHVLLLVVIVDVSQKQVP